MKGLCWLPRPCVSANPVDCRRRRSSWWVNWSRQSPSEEAGSIGRGRRLLSPSKAWKEKKKHPTTTAAATVGRRARKVFLRGSALELCVARRRHLFVVQPNDYQRSCFDATRENEHRRDNIFGVNTLRFQSCLRCVCVCARALFANAASSSRRSSSRLKCQNRRDGNMKDSKRLKSPVTVERQRRKLSRFDPVRLSKLSIEHQSCSKATFLQNGVRNQKFSRGVAAFVFLRAKSMRERYSVAVQSTNYY